ncbi:MAG TPA: FmdB family zinc ribbon protein [Thermoanaerobaculia bacterium]|nr:FmdB family zinc ribbon protein [Thermoanaerobaculia bacterium]
MPIYEYVCGSCKKKTEVIQRVNEAPLKVCPHCGGKLKKAISAPAIQFKGSGFYITDYARGSSSGGEGGSKSAGEKSESRGDKSEKAGKSEKVEKKADKKEKKASGD